MNDDTSEFLWQKFKTPNTNVVNNSVSLLSDLYERYNESDDEKEKSLFLQ